MRNTFTLRVVLRALLDSPKKPIYASELARDTGLGQTTVCRAMHRLAREQWAATCLSVQKTHGRHRRIFLLTNFGIREARALLDDSQLP
jgi:predicted ArsR family transcriptional regulator